MIIKFSRTILQESLRRSVWTNCIEALRVDGVQLSLPSHKVTKPQGHRPSKFQRACSELIHHIIEAFKKEIKLGRKLLVQVHFF